jgi:hypothetical protein
VMRCDEEDKKCGGASFFDPDETKIINDFDRSSSIHPSIGIIPSRPRYGPHRHPGVVVYQSSDKVMDGCTFAGGLKDACDQYAERVRH